MHFSHPVNQPQEASPARSEAAYDNLFREPEFADQPAEDDVEDIEPELVRRDPEIIRRGRDIRAGARRTTRRRTAA
ncbi:hypothetical protein [Actinophytocola sp.]|jgi:hypothetical protein|uniref:hypothetical protein n=1 Tax=Actinophytocola sp. TaxID=1872138 RepID=UPI002ED7C6AC